jgi:hypothetical protein
MTVQKLPNGFASPKLTVRTHICSVGFEFECSPANAPLVYGLRRVNHPQRLHIAKRVPPKAARTLNWNLAGKSHIRKEQR